MQNIKTKILTAFMSAVLVFTLFPALSSNAAGTGKWNDNGITYQLDSDGTFTISGTGASQKFSLYTSLVTDAPWYSDRSYIKKVVIGDGISHIGDNSFFGCYNLKEIQFSSAKTLKSIGTQAFANCSGITGVALPYGLVSVGTQAFLCCNGITTLTIPNTVKTLSRGCFAYCTSLTKVYLPASVTSIGNLAFASDSKLAQVTGGAGLVSIGQQAFERTYKLKVFKVASKKLKKIGLGTFWSSGLKTLYIKGTTKLSKKGVKYSLYRSSVKTVKVKKSKVKKYKKYFTRKNCGRKVKVKK